MPPSSLETAEKFCRPGAKNQYSLIRSDADIDRACRVMGGLLAGAGCMDGRVHEAAGEDFRIVKIHSPTHGRITAATGREFPWDLGDLAIAGPAPEPGPDIPVTPELTDFRVEGCRDAVRASVTEVTLQSLGRVVQMDVTLNCVQFSVPETLDVAGEPGSICNARSFRARVIANYVDTDFTACEAQAVIL